LKVPARVWREMFGALMQYDDMPEIGRIGAPVLLIWGDQDGIVSREMEQQLAACLACAELVVYSGVGHTPRWEDPSRFAADVAAFVERLLPS
jgi:pimeloyl-ACP methyl ester carboxylesterase